VTYHISHDIPIPPPLGRKQGSRSGYKSELSKTMDSMQVGDSFHIRSKEDRDGVTARWNVFLPKRFRVREEDCGWRVWRVA
jgi:hypothetical protein